MREAELGGRTVLVLREPKVIPDVPAPHLCVVLPGERSVKSDVGAIIQCTCGKRYRCRISHLDEDYGVWVRRILPWPPKQKDWPG